MKVLLMKFLFLPVPICLLLAGMTASQTNAQYYSAEPPATSGGIYVSGSGEIQAKPDIVEINMRIVGKAELTDDAIVKHRDARKRVQDAFSALKIENIELAEQDLALRPGNSQEMYRAAMNGEVATSSRNPIEIASNLRLRLSKISDTKQEDLMKTIGKLLDVAQDSGAGIGPSQADMSMAYRYGRVTSGAIVTFVISDIDELREKAYRMAVDDAKARAERLAKLNNLKLGPAISIQEVLVSGEGSARPVQPWEVQSNNMELKSGEVTSETFSQSRFQVKLMVRFAIEAEGAKEKTAAVQ